MKYIKLDHLTELNIISNQLSKEKMLRSIVLVALAGAVTAIQLDTEQCCNSMVMSCCGNDSDDGQKNASPERSVTELIDDIIHPEPQDSDDDSDDEGEGSVSTHIPEVDENLAQVVEIMEDKYADEIQDVCVFPWLLEEETGVSDPAPETTQAELDVMIDEIVKDVAEAGGPDAYLENGPAQPTEEEKAVDNYMESF